MRLLRFLLAVVLPEQALQIILEDHERPFEARQQVDRGRTWIGSNKLPLTRDNAAAHFDVPPRQGYPAALVGGLSHGPI